MRYKQLCSLRGNGSMYGGMRKKVERIARLNRAFRQGGGRKYLHTPRRPQRRRRGQYHNTMNTIPNGYYHHQGYYGVGGNANVGQHARYDASSSDAMLR